MAGSRGTGRAPTAPPVVDEAALHQAMAVSVRDGPKKETSVKTFCASMATSIVTPAANVAVRAQVKGEFATTI